MSVARHRKALLLGNDVVSYLEWTPESPRGEVLLIHGGSFDSAELSWGVVGRALAEAGWHVYAPDTPGYGSSPAPDRRNTQERLVNYVDDLADALGLQRFVLGGLSMGGGMSLGFTLGNPDRVRALMLLDSYGTLKRTSEGWFSLPVHLLSWALLRSGLAAIVAKHFARRSTPRMLEWSMRSIVRNPASRTPELVESLLAEARRHSSGQDGFRQWQNDQFLLTRTRTNYLPWLHDLTLPVLIINGERDLIIPAAAAVRTARALTNSTLLIVAGAGHWVQRDAPELVIAAMARFLDGLPH